MKKSISLALCVLMLAQLLCGLCVSAEAADSIRDTASQVDVEKLITQSYTKTEPPADATPINSAGEFANMTANGVYYLNADLELTSSYSEFKGKLYGNGHTLTLKKGSGYRAKTNPVFATLRGAEIYDLTIKSGEQLSAEVDYLGALAEKAYNTTIRGLTNEVNVHNSKRGYSDGTNNVYTGFSGGLLGYAENVTLSYCTNKGAITGHETETRPGGLVGEMRNADATLTLDHCINYGEIKGVNQTGGLVSRVEKGAEVKFSYCANFGTVTVGWSDGGGLIGKVTQSNTKVTFEHCYNSARINGGSNTGGMIGFMLASELTVTDCHNGCFVKGCTCKGSEHGKLTNQKGTHTIGGLVAHMDQRSAVVTFTDCSNSGHLIAGEGGVRNDSADANINKSHSRVGGIAAVIEGYRAKVENCHNYGKITSDYYVGGLFARIGSSGEATTSGSTTVYSGSTLLLKGCSNSGELISASYVGGAIGYQEFASDLTLTDCHNYGNITAGWNAGGLLARIDSGHTKGCTIELTDCSNSGTINAKGTAGGLTGIFTGTYDVIKSMSVTKCTNTADVTSPNYAGGIVGIADVKKFTATDCRNEGDMNVKDQGEYGCVGGIVGRTYGTASYTNCVNTGNMIESDTVKKGGSAYGLSVGGIVGQSGRGGTDYKADTSVFVNCFSAGTIVAKSALHKGQSIRAAGIVGVAKSTCIANRCLVIGEINGTTQAAGIAGDCGSNGQGGSEFNQCIVDAPIFNSGTAVNGRTEGSAGIACYVWGDAHVLNCVVMNDVTLTVNGSSLRFDQRRPCSALVGYTNNGGGSFQGNFFGGKLTGGEGTDTIVMMLANTVEADVSGDIGGDINHNYSHYQYPLFYWGNQNDKTGVTVGGYYSEELTPLPDEDMLKRGVSFADIMTDGDPNMTVIRNCAGVELPMISYMISNYNWGVEHVGGHGYYENCNPTCTVCGREKVLLTHRYTNDCDVDCNDCGDVREVVEHEFGRWIVVKQATETEKGERKVVCETCGHEEFQVIPMLKPESEPQQGNGEADNTDAAPAEDKLPIPMIAGVGGGAALLIVLVVILVIVAKKKKK